MNDTITASQLIDHYALSPHPEGGYFKETYRSSEMISPACLPERFKGERRFSTAIYFLLETGNFSAFHRISSDECWHFYAGGRLLVYVIHKNGEGETILMGPGLLDGEQVQAVVPAECWFAAEPAPGSSYSFVGCTVAPGFDFEDFELARGEDLSREFPQHTALIKRLSRQ